MKTLQKLILHLKSLKTIPDLISKAHTYLFRRVKSKNKKSIISNSLKYEEQQNFVYWAKNYEVVGFYLQSVSFSVKVQSFNVTAVYGEKGSREHYKFCSQAALVILECLCLKLASLYGPVNVTKRPLFNTREHLFLPCI